MDIVLFGIQGSGKGTLGKAISAKYRYNYFEMGGELRRLASEDSDLGRKVKAVIESGQLVSNEIVNEILGNYIKTKPADTPIIYDGFPRELDQAKMFEETLKENNREFKGILVEISEDVALKRLTTRRICGACKTVYPADYDKTTCEKCSGELITRTDDNPESIKTRIAAYNKQTMPVIKKFQEEDKIITMDGTPAIPEATASIFKIIDNLK